MLPSGHEEVGDEELDKEEVARLKREKRERMRREALAAGGGEGGGAGLDVGSGDEEGEDFIPLDGGQRLSKGERRLERVGGWLCVYVFPCVWVGDGIVVVAAWMIKTYMRLRTAPLGNP